MCIQYIHPRIYCKFRKSVTFIRNSICWDYLYTKSQNKQNTPLQTADYQE